MSTQATTVRYNNKKWVIDAERKRLHPENDTKTQIDIDEIWDELSDKDQNKIAFLLSAITDKDIDGYEEDNEEED